MAEEKKDPLDGVTTKEINDALHEIERDYSMIDDSKLPKATSIPDHATGQNPVDDEDFGVTGEKPGPIVDEDFGVTGEKPHPLQEEVFDKFGVTGEKQHPVQENVFDKFGVTGEAPDIDLPPNIGEKVTQAHPESNRGPGDSPIDLPPGVTFPDPTLSPDLGGDLVIEDQYTIMIGGAGDDVELYTLDTSGTPPTLSQAGRGEVELTARYSETLPPELIGYSFQDEQGNTVTIDTTQEPPEIHHMAGRDTAIAPEVVYTIGVPELPIKGSGPFPIEGPPDFEIPGGPHTDAVGESGGVPDRTTHAAGEEGQAPEPIDILPIVSHPVEPEEPKGAINFNDAIKNAGLVDALENIRSEMAGTGIQLAEIDTKQDLSNLPEVAEVAQAKGNQIT